MKKQNLIRYFLFIVTVILVSCQTNSVTESISKGSSNISSDISQERKYQPTSRTCWKEITTYLNSSEQQTFILAMGANTGNLKKANDDAKNFKEAMKKRFEVPKEQICLLTNVYRAEFEKALKDLRSQVKSDDRVIIFFSGHGSYIKDDNGDEADRLDDVFITMDVNDLKTPRRMDAMTDDAFVKLVNALPTQNVITFIDACHSGGMYQGKNSKSIVTSKFFIKGIFGEVFSFFDSETMPSNQLRYLARINGVVLAAAKESEDAWEDPNEGGLFTTTFLKQLQRYPEVSLKKIFDDTKTNIVDIQYAKAIQVKKYQHPQIIGNIDLVN